MASDPELKSSKIVASNLEFALDLYKVTAKKNENCFISPFSIYSALVLTYVGAKGKTAEEIVQYLHLPTNQKDVLNGVRALLDELKKKPCLNTATEIFVETTYKLKKEYTETVKKYLDSESQLVDFLTAASEAERIINSWVSVQTKDKIRDIIPSGTLDKDTRLVLVNAIHFKDDWQNMFREASTSDQPFYTSKESSIMVPMMRQTDYFGYAEKDTFQVLELMYKDNDFRMVILLPREVDGLGGLEQTITSSVLNDALSSLKRAKVHAQIPKFKLEKFINLNDALQELGIRAMFDPQHADFTEIHEPGEHPLYVSQVLHKAFVEVNEKGTEAAAATAVVMARCLCAFTEEEIIHDFIVDRPFSFYVFYRNLILFTGKHVSN